MWIPNIQIPNSNFLAKCNFTNSIHVSSLMPPIIYIVVATVIVTINFVASTITINITINVTATTTIMVASPTSINH